MGHRSIHPFQSLYKVINGPVLAIHISKIVFKISVGWWIWQG